MQKPDIPENDLERLAALERYKILDTSPEQAFNDLAEIAAEICETPIALISLVDKQRQWFKARVGIDASETPRDISFCAHAVANQSMLMVPDATQDRRFCDNPLVLKDPKIRFYAGIPLITLDNWHLGTLCVIDRKPRQLTAQQQKQLERLSRLVINQLESRLSEHHLQQQLKVTKLANQERIAAEVEQYNLSTRLSLAAKSGGIGIWEWDFVNKKLTWNERMHELYGTSHDAFKGCLTDWSSRVHPEDLPEALSQFQRAVTESKEFDTKFRVIHPDGQVWYLKGNGLIEYNQQNEPQRMIGINVDISTLKKAEADVMQALERERELSQIRSSFISTISHEFRTPLAVISAKTELLKLLGDKLDRAEQEECLNTILNYVEHTTDLLNDVLIVSKAESGKLKLNLQFIDVVDLSQKLSQEIELCSPSHHCEFVVQDSRPNREEYSSHAQLDRKIIQQILTNLLTNASKYSPVRSKVILRLELLPKKVKFSIIDRGIGIPEEDQRHLFEPFHRATNVGNAPGTGLGLSIVKHLVNIHQGKIEVSSTVGKGSCFTVQIPTQWHMPS